MKIKITEFGDKYCPPCKKQAPIMKKLKKKHPDWEINTVDIEKNEELADKNNVEMVPTFIVQKGSKKKKWEGGPVEVDEMEKIIQRM